MPDKMPEDISEYMPEDMSDRMPDRMSEDLSIKKYINIMGGITRNKIIFQ
jgi:hypothetical protein